MGERGVHGATPQSDYAHTVLEMSVRVIQNVHADVN